MKKNMKGKEIFTNVGNANNIQFILKMIIYA